MEASEELFPNYKVGGLLGLPRPMESMLYPSVLFSSYDPLC